MFETKSTYLCAPSRPLSKYLLSQISPHVLVPWDLQAARLYCELLEKLAEERYMRLGRGRDLAANRRPFRTYFPVWSKVSGPRPPMNHPPALRPCSCPGGTAGVVLLPLPSATLRPSYFPDPTTRFTLVKIKIGMSIHSSYYGTLSSTAGNS